MEEAGDAVFVPRFLGKNPTIAKTIMATTTGTGDYGKG
jgi:hypothetical protein